MTTRCPGHEKRMAGEFIVKRRGTVAVKVTAQELVAAAINAVQNGWPLEAMGCNWLESNAATQRMLEQVYEAALEVNRLAVEKRLASQGR